MEKDDDLERLAKKAVSEKQNKKADTELRKYISDTYEVKNHRQITFILEYIKTGVQYKAYQKAYGEYISNASASVMACNLLKEMKFQVVDFLDNSGHSIGVLMETLETLRMSDPKEYIKYMLKLRGLDIQKTEVSGSLELPGIVINTFKTEEEDD